MKKAINFIFVMYLIESCSVQQFAVNTDVKPFQNGGKLKGENTKKMVKNRDFVKDSTFYIIGINISSETQVEKMVKSLNAEHYTVQTRTTFGSLLLFALTGGLVSHSQTKVIKRDN